jgi:hypothetical protein
VQGRVTLGRLVEAQIWKVQAVLGQYFPFCYALHAAKFQHEWSMCVEGALNGVENQCTSSRCINRELSRAV